MLILITLSALLLDGLLGEPKTYHPLVAYGWYVNLIEKLLNRKKSKRWPGVLAVCLALLPFIWALYLINSILQFLPFLDVLFSVLILYFCIGWRSLGQHARRVSEPLQRGDLAEARYAVSMMVSRNTENLNAEEVATAASESVLENGADAIFAPLFWFWLAGVPGVLIYRLSNTLDAMWGYKNERFFYFGWAAAKLDDVLNWLPARFTALAYALMGSTFNALRCWYKQASQWDSPNAGPVMASGAGALNTQLGGAAMYHGVLHKRPVLGSGKPATLATIEQACVLINYSLILWLLVFITLWGLY